MSADTEKKSALASGNLMISLMMVLVIAMVLVIGAVGVVAVSGAHGSASTGGSSTVSVTLSEFAITIDPATVPAGKVTLQIHNAGSAEHNVAVPSLGKRTANIAVGGNATLELGDISEALELICEVPGHKESGMVAKLGIGAAADGMEGMAGMGGSSAPMSNDQMDAAMEAVAKL
ncbi:MAG: hypothetical protein ACKOQ7_08005, partial [Actinomycetota bacterium]